MGLVPTMGAIHQGHLSLVEASLKECDRTAVTIFVNPTQFAPGEDLDSYPQPLEEDLNQLRALGVNMVYSPFVREVYPDAYSTYITVEGLTTMLCGKSRPAHFRGVTTVVCKFFNTFRPDRAFFGLKDYQQTVVVRRMVRDLDMNIQIRCCPIVREPDGLAMSSRNRYLSPEERQQALALSESLRIAESMITPDTSPETIRDIIQNRISSKPLARIDYIEIRHPETLEPVTDFDEGAVIALAVIFGKTRLIDNCLIAPGSDPFLSKNFKPASSSHPESYDIEVDCMR